MLSSIDPTTANYLAQSIWTVCSASRSTIMDNAATCTVGCTEAWRLSQYYSSITIDQSLLKPAEKFALAIEWIEWICRLVESRTGCKGQCAADTIHGKLPRGGAIVRKDKVKVKIGDSAIHVSEYEMLDIFFLWEWEGSGSIFSSSEKV